MTIPPVTDRPFNQRLAGVFGEFGAGSGVRAVYLQSALAPAQLDRISLISDIEGSEQWPVRSLFQRDVDQERVTDRLLPYLETEDKVKFFNPITLTLLPMSSDAVAIEEQMPRLVEARRKVDGEGPEDWHCLTNGRYYQLRWMADHPEFSVLEWNDVRTRLVAIDGQHRLSALKRLWKDQASKQHGRLAGWRVPVVVVTFQAQPKISHLPRLVDVVRNIFMYINTTAQLVSPARRVLLSDESPSAIGVQELLQRSHENDLRPLSERDAHRVPLLFYDWRGKERRGRPIPAPAAVKNVEELRDWFFHYILRGEIRKQAGERYEFTTGARTALDIVPTDPLHAAFANGGLDHKSGDLLRHRFRSAVLPAVEHLLQNFTPYAQYVKGLRRLERDYRDRAKSDLARHAFGELRFGSNRAEESVKDAVNTERQRVEIAIEKLQEKHLTGVVRLDLGMRGVMAAFGNLRQRFDNPDWMEYAERFVIGLNLLYKDGWMGTDRRRTHRSDLRHISEDHDGGVVNYRLDQVPDALGAYLELLVAAHGGRWEKSWTRDWQGQREALFDTLEDTVRRGYRKEFRPELRVHYPMGGKELTDAVSRKAKPKAAGQIRRLRKELDRIKGIYKGC